MRLKTAQAWSGHKTASVLLDTYLCVMRGDEERFQAFLTADQPNLVTAPRGLALKLGGGVASEVAAAPNAARRVAASLPLLLHVSSCIEHERKARGS